MKFRDMVIKDMKLIIYDVKSLAIILIMPIVLMSILGMSLQGVFGEETESGVAMTQIGVVKAYDLIEEMEKVEGKMDLSRYNQETLDGLNAEMNFFRLLDNPEIKSFLDYTLMTEAEGLEALEEEAITALIVLPKNFVFNNYMLLEGSRLVTEIEYFINPENDFFANIVLGIIHGYTDMTNHIYAQQRVTMMTLLSTGNTEALLDINSTFDETALEIGGLNIAVKATQREESITSFQYYSAAIMCMFLLYTAGIGGRALLDERRNHTIPRQTVGGQGLMSIVMSNFIRVMCLASIQSGIMIVYSGIALGVDWGSTTTVLVTVFLSSFSIASLGMFIAVITLIANNYKVANAFEFGVVYVMALVGGSFIPIEGLPVLMQKMGFISVNGQALKMYINGMYELPLRDSITQILVMMIFGLIFVGASLLLIRGKGRELAC